MTGRCWETLPDVWKWLEAFWMFVSGWEAFTGVQKWFGALPEVQE